MSEFDFEFIMKQKDKTLLLFPVSNGVEDLFALQKTLM